MSGWLGISSQADTFTAGSAQEAKGQGERGHVQSEPPVSLRLLLPDAKLPPRCKQKELLSSLAWLVISTHYLTSEHFNNIVWQQVNLTHHGKVQKLRRTGERGLMSAGAVSNTMVL